MWKAVAEKTLAEQQKQLGKPVTFEQRHLDEEQTQTRKHKPTSHHLIDFIPAIFEPDASKVYPNPTVCDLDLFWSEVDE